MSKEANLIHLMFTIPLIIRNQESKRLRPYPYTHRRKKDHGRAEALLIVAWALGLRALKPRPEEPGDIIITESDGSIPGSTIIADSTLRDALHEGEGPVSSA